MPSLNLKQQYQQKIRPQLARELKLANPLSAPQVEKVVINMGVGEAVQDKSLLENASQDLQVITGQKPKMTRARVSIAGFKLREGMPIGLMVTLRRQRMYDFLEKLFKIVLPRLRDFQGVSRQGFDGRGNYNLGIREQTVFPEVDGSKVERNRSLQVTIITSAKKDKPAERLLELLGMPFEKKTDGQKK